jgi:hypothetical protein
MEPEITFTLEPWHQIVAVVCVALACIYAGAAVLIRYKGAYVCEYDYDRQNPEKKLCTWLFSPILLPVYLGVVLCADVLPRLFRRPVRKFTEVVLGAKPQDWRS